MMSSLADLSGSHTPNVIAEIFVITKAGDILFRHKYRKDITVTPSKFVESVEVGSPVDPVQKLGEEHWMCVLESDLYWVAATKNEESDALIIYFLDNWHSICHDLCGTMSPKSIAANLLLMVEIAMEIADQGYIQLMKKENIKVLLESEPVIVSKPKSLSSSVGLYVDLVENIQAKVESDGTVSKFTVMGHLKLRSTEPTNKPVKILLNKPVNQGKQEGFGTGVWVAECNIDPKIYSVELGSKGCLEAVPYESGTTLFSYTLHTPPAQLLPIAGHASVTPLPSGEVEVTVKLSLKNEVVWLEADLPVPAATKHVRHSSPSWKLDRDAMCLRASIRTAIPAAQQLVLTAVLEGGSASTEKYGPLTVKLEMSQFVVSGLKVTRVIPPAPLPGAPPAAKWVRHVSLVDTFIMDLSS